MALARNLSAAPRGLGGVGDAAQRCGCAASPDCPVRATGRVAAQQAPNARNRGGAK
jgi:hypothetical protein